MKLLTLENITKDSSLIEPGVYKIFLFERGLPKSISRFLNNDETGLIYIGAAEKTSLAYRLTCFLASKNSEKKQNNHSGGNKIKHNVQLSLFTSKLVFMYEVIVTKDAKKKEREMLKNYINYFGEVPPLNG